MDDGNRIHNTVTISVHGFSKESIERLAGILSGLEVESRIHNDGHGARLYIPTKGYSAFEGLVKPYGDEVPCMAYKLVQPRRDYTLAPAKAG